MTPDINSLIGIPFVLGGRDLKGMDCWGLVVEVYRRMGREIPDFDSGMMNRPEIIRKIRDGEVLVPMERLDTPEQWCLILDESKGHVGLWINGAVLHASRHAGVIIQPWRSFQTLYFQSRFFRCLA